MPQLGGFAMKKLLVILMVIAGFGLVMGLGFRRAAAHEHGGQGSSLKTLAGNYSFTTQGSYSLCLDTSKTPPAVEDCGTTGALVLPQTYLAVGEATRDDNGNSCSTWTEVNSSLPVDNTPPLVQVGRHAVGKPGIYDSATGTGEISFTAYSGGKCNGSTFDITGATETGTTDAHFVASSGGKRIDFLYTSLTGFVTDTTGNIFGDFSLSGPALKQEK